MTWQQAVEDYAAAAGWVSDLAGRLTAGQWSGRTPCEDYTVRDLLGHLLGTAHRALATVRDESTRSIPHVVTNVPDHTLVARYAQLTGMAAQEWGRGTDPDRAVVAPWGPCTALDAVYGFTVETLVHGWDLAMATAQEPEQLSGEAARALDYVHVPDRLRGVMYADPAPTTPEEGPTTRLARALGRAPEWPRTGPGHDC